MPYRKFGIVVAALILFVLSVRTGSAEPPAGSPLATGQHPRLFFTQADIPSLRARIAEHYRGEFQSLLNLLGNPAAQLNANQRLVEANWGPVNYAFVAALDPAALQALGFSLPGSYDTASELCAAAMTYTDQLLPRILEGRNTGHDVFSEGFPSPLHLGPAIAYDWCYSHFTPAARTRIADAFISVYNAEYAGKRYAAMAFGSNQWLGNNLNSALIHNLLGILAFYGDAYPAPALQASMYEAFEGIWIDRLQFELQQFYGGSSGWHEGPGAYHEEGYLNLGIGVKMFSSALGVDYFGNTRWFTEGPEFLHAIVVPHSRETGCGPDGRSRCPILLQRFGDVASGIAKPSCKMLNFMSGMLRTSAPTKASLAKYLYQDLSAGCQDVVSRAGGIWTNGVLYWFLSGDRGVSTEAPLGGWRSVERLGLGHFSFNNATSQVAFFAQPFEMYGHGMKPFGHFTIHKYGDLILKPGNAKGGDARITGNGSNLFHNSIGVHKGGDDKILAENGDVPDEVFQARGLRQIRTGVTRGEMLARTFSYVFFDGTVGWGPKVLDVMHREFVYLKGPENSEYVLTLDRLRSPTPETSTKIWKAWVPSQPRFVNGVVSSPRTGKWTSDNANTLEITNNLSNLKTDFFESAPTHGRLYLRALSPDDAVISVLGGPGKEYQSGNDNGETPWGTPVMNDAMRSYLGWGRIEIRPGARRNADTFLAVMQFGDSRTLTQMSPIVKLRSTDNLSVGAHIRDSNNEWVVMFAESAANVLTLGEVRYSYQPASGGSSHLIANMLPNRTYYVARSVGAAATSVNITQNQAAGSSPVVASSDGVVFFELAGAQIVIPSPPSAPRRLRLVP